MKKLMLIISILITIRIQAQIPVMEISKEGVKKVIVAVDLQIQRLQNETIWLQNAQKAIENTMSKLRLDEISEWVEKQRKLYADYFNELRQVKNGLVTYHRIKDIIEQQLLLIKEYKSAWSLFRQDKNFTSDELDYMKNIYSGMLEESDKNLDQLSLVINAFVTQMTDAQRLEVIDQVAEKVEMNLMDLKDFNEQNKMLSLQRATERNDIEYVKKLYGF